MSRPARSTSAVWSTTAGGLPGPAVIARLSVLSASRTTAGPPVTRRTRTPGWLMSARAVSIVGSRRRSRGPAGRRRATIARLMSRIVSAEQRFALGCALKTTALPAETMLIVLLMIVEVGFVTGVIAATTPNGANSVTIIPASPVTACDLEVLGPGRLRGDEPVLDDLVLDPPEVGLLVGHPGELLGVVEHRPADGLDDRPCGPSRPWAPEGAEGRAWRRRPPRRWWRGCRRPAPPRRRPTAPPRRAGRRPAARRRPRRPAGEPVR